MLMGFEQGIAGAVDAQPARPEDVLVLPSETEVEQHELTHLPFSETGVDTAYVPRVKKAHHESSLGGVSKFAADYMFMG